MKRPPWGVLICRSIRHPPVYGLCGPRGPGLALIHLVGLTNGSPAAVAAAEEWVLAVEHMWGLIRAV